ncbi:hypothetical protein F5Y09DRAFT_344745 [Xylaria sp. FL1042]|nr:hypothetical protein F5Y09DRAFT_344745 [Xylaria sp. FL1042]
MGHQEASPPPQRHRVPHHRRHRRHRHHSHHHAAAAQAIDRPPPLSLGRLNREFHAPSSHATVERWLGQLTAPVPATRLVSPPSRNQPLHHGKRLRSQDSYGSSYRQRPRRVDRLRGPEHIPLEQGSSPPRLPLLTNLDKNSKRHKRSSDDSSLISDLNLRREPQRWDGNETTSEHGKSSRSSPLDETEVGAVDTSSPVSRIDMMQPTFEKRPRHKTRPDKYDTKKSNARERRTKVTGQCEHQSRVSKSKKRKHVVDWKNVMKNFTSEAVTNGRITVRPNLKPGLFNNKRAPKEHPIADLCFSEMPFPTHQERDIPQKGGLSSSRVREIQRENRELEQISSFFLPACADTTLRSSNQIKTKDDKAARKNEPTYGDNVIPSSPSDMTQSYHQQSFLSLENSSIPTATAGGPDCRPNSSKTTYFTWSSSQHSPQCRSCLVDTPLETMESTRSAAPEVMRGALATTGVYEDTGIRLYDDSRGPQKHVLQVLGEYSSTSSSIVDQRDAHEQRESAINHRVKAKPRCANDTSAIMARLARLEDRWNAILPPEWKLQRLSEDKVSLVDKQQKDMASVKISSRAELPSRQEMAEEARLKPVRQYSRAHQSCHDGDPDSTSNMHHTPKSPMLILEDSAPADGDRATITSRDAMPPPPVPLHRVGSLCSTNPKPERDPDSSIPIETARPPDTGIQISNSEQPVFINPYEATDKMYKLSNQSEKVIPTLDSISWIPQAPTSGISSYDRDESSSRLSMRSSIYENQGKEVNPNGTLRLISPPTAHTSETMADFIARIESELDEPTCLNEYYRPESIIENQGFSVDQIAGPQDIQNQHLMATNEAQVDYHLDDAKFKDVLESSKSMRGHELAASVRDNSATMRTECRENDDIDEFLEMSNFWRPNRFSNL